MAREVERGVRVLLQVMLEQRVEGGGLLPTRADRLPGGAGLIHFGRKVVQADYDVAERVRKIYETERVSFDARPGARGAEPAAPGDGRNAQRDAETTEDRSFPKGVGSGGSSDISYAASMKKECAIEAYKAKLAGRKDKIEELKLEIDLEDDEEKKKAAKRKLLQFLRENPPPEATQDMD